MIHKIQPKYLIIIQLTYCFKIQLIIQHTQINNIFNYKIKNFLVFTIIKLLSKPLSKQSLLIPKVIHMEQHAINFNYKFKYLSIELIYLSQNKHIVLMLEQLFSFLKFLLKNLLLIILILNFSLDHLYFVLKHIFQ